MSSKTGKLDASAFWARVDYLRRIHDMTVTDLQLAIGKTGTYLYVAKSNLAMPSTDIIVKMADVFGCSTDFLLGHVMKEECEDKELSELIQRWKIDEQFQALIRQLMKQLG